MVVLNEFTKYEGQTVLYHIGFGILLFICFAMLIVTVVKHPGWGLFFLTAALIFSIIFVSSGFLSEVKKETKRYLEVKIDESVNITEFSKKYQVVSVDGDILLLLDKEYNME